MKKILCLLLALCMVLALTACGSSASSAEQSELEKIKSTGVLTVSMSPDFAPMEFVDSSKSGQEQYVGFDVTLAQYLADYFGVELEIVPMSFDTCSTAVSSHTVNMSISGFSWKQDREDNFELSDTYHASDNEDAQVLLIRAEDAEKFTSAGDFNGVSVGAQNSSLQQALVNEQLPDANLEVFGDIGVGVLELQQGNVDAIAVAEGNAKQLLLNNKGLVICDWQFYVSEKYKDNLILIAKGETELLAEVNKALAQAKADDLYTGWYEEAVALGEALGALD